MVSSGYSSFLTRMTLIKELKTNDYRGRSVRNHFNEC